MKIGIITNGANTFRISDGNKSGMFNLENIPGDYLNDKMSFMDYFAGSFQEIMTLKEELSSFGTVEVTAFLGNHSYHENQEMTIWDLIKGRKKEIDLEAWMNEIDVLIFCLDWKSMNPFFRKYIIPMEKRIIISSGNNTLSYFKKVDLHLPRKGVARFGKDNRRKIVEYLERIGDE